MSVLFAGFEYLYTCDVCRSAAANVTKEPVAFSGWWRQSGWQSRTSDEDVSFHVCPACVLAELEDALGGSR